MWQLVLSHNTMLSGGVDFLFSRIFTSTSLEFEHIIKGRCLLSRAHFDHLALLTPMLQPMVQREEKFIIDGMAMAQRFFLFLCGDFNCTVN